MMPFTAAKLGAVQGSVIVVVGRVTGSRVIKTRVFGLSRCLARGNEPDVQCLRFDDHARDMAFDDPVPF